MNSLFGVRSLILGLVSWAVPFCAAALFFDEHGDLTIPRPLFKSIMVVCFGGVGCWLLLLQFCRTNMSIRSGFLLGFYWCLINLIMDYFILLPLAGMEPLEYFYDIGLKYLLMPIIGASLGSAATTSAGRLTKRAD